MNARMEYMDCYMCGASMDVNDRYKRTVPTQRGREHIVVCGACDEQNWDADGNPIND